MIEDLVRQIESRFEELSREMTDPAVIGDRERYADVGRAYRALEPAHALARLRDLEEGLVLLCLSGRGDKDLAEVLAR